MKKVRGLSQTTRIVTNGQEVTVVDSGVLTSSKDLGDVDGDVGLSLKVLRLEYRTLDKTKRESDPKDNEGLRLVWELGPDLRSSSGQPERGRGSAGGERRPRRET